jgi:hypothetical protein
MRQALALQILLSGRSVFLTGEPGAGKSFTIREFMKRTHRRNADRRPNNSRLVRHRRAPGAVPFGRSRHKERSGGRKDQARRYARHR